jgi:hypothetical protein
MKMKVPLWFCTPVHSRGSQGTDLVGRSLSRPVIRSTYSRVYTREFKPGLNLNLHQLKWVGSTWVRTWIDSVHTAANPGSVNTGTVRGGI